jgi:hypothetical protein
VGCVQLLAPPVCLAGATENTDPSCGGEVRFKKAWLSKFV